MTAIFGQALREGLNIRIPVLIPIKRAGFINHRSWLPNPKNVPSVSDDSYGILVIEVGVPRNSLVVFLTEAR